jgi:hypothetical protein
MAYVSGRVFAGQKVGLGITAEALHATQACREVLLQNDSTNTADLLVGNSSGQYVQIDPGQSLTLPVVSLNLIWVKMASGTGTVNWIARD